MSEPDQPNQPSQSSRPGEAGSDDFTQPHRWLKVRRSGPRMRVTLARPDQRNAQTPTLWKALADLAEGLDPEVRVVVIDAEGTDFSAGLDRQMLTPDEIPGEPRILAVAANRGPGELEQLIAGFQKGFTAWGAVDALVIAAVQGNAIGAGFQLALAADLRIVSEDVRLAMREPSLGLVPDLGGTGPLVQTLGYSRALEICVTSRFVGAGEAVGSGLATLAVPGEKLSAVTDEVVEAILEIPDRALRETKQLLRAAVHNTASEQLLAERQAQARLLISMVGGTSGASHDHAHPHPH